ncbi:MAG: dipeptide ABC transporter ATP-binding protein [Gammaproteobacteria bacterium]|nr:dipeptide ABC transporter ATP-binding protein [Gammaproteobacteria bacterium]
MTALLDVKSLKVRFAGEGLPVQAVDGVDFRIDAGETLALLGESGSGKSVTALSITRLLPKPAEISGSVLFNGADLLTLPETSIRAFRGGHIAMIFQEPQTSLNPALRVGVQVGESLRQHRGLRGKARRGKVIELLEAVGIPEPARRVDDYPHQFSGGMKQRVMLAIALAGEPELLIADEPTTALDVTTQARMLELLKKLQRDTGMAILFITHDLAVASRVSDRVAVMNKGRIVETGPTRQFFDQPQHPYSKNLLASLPDARARRMEQMPVPGAPMLRVSGLEVQFPTQTGFFGGSAGYLRAVDGVSLELKQGRTLAVVGESGSGKTTLGKGILQLLKPAAGTVYLDGDNLLDLSPSQLRRQRAHMQVVFQDPFSSMNPQMMVKDIIEEGMLSLGTGESAAHRQAVVDDLLTQVGLEPGFKYRYPHEFSGGQRQRICIARALAVRPKLLVCDEPTSALDVTVQARILALLASLQQELGLAYLFITHNISVVASFADDVAVMYRGRIVEQGATGTVLASPQHEYTKTLLAAVPTVRK